MKIVKDMALMTIGAVGVIVYQKYKKPVIEKVEKVAGEAISKVNNKLEDMV